jgi:hypothetical protein
MVSATVSPSTWGGTDIKAAVEKIRGWLLTIASDTNRATLQSNSDWFGQEIGAMLDVLVFIVWLCNGKDHRIGWVNKSIACMNHSMAHRPHVEQGGGEITIEPTILEPTVQRIENGLSAILVRSLREEAQCITRPGSRKDPLAPSETRMSAEAVCEHILLTESVQLEGLLLFLTDMNFYTGTTWDQGECKIVRIADSTHVRAQNTRI